MADIGAARQAGSDVGRIDRGEDVGANRLHGDAVGLGHLDHASAIDAVVHDQQGAVPRHGGAQGGLHGRGPGPGEADRGESVAPAG
ncbi:MAG: hypothetical protein HY803_10640 [candidate division NC10 bacterium]|nr:hypothetical protein [candidate division NC10 bacterium]